VLVLAIMKISSNCTLVAAALSAAYRTYDGHGFPPSSLSYPSSMRLEDFLDHNGILLTMCMSHRGLIPWLECSRPKSSTDDAVAPWSSTALRAAPGDATDGGRVAASAGGSDPSRLEASWVQQDQTRGFRVIGRPIDIGPPVGLILRPSGTSIRCIYPVDGATDARDGRGCGPLTNDPSYGSQGYDHAKWYRKMLYREEIVRSKNSLFGPNRTWESIPCTDFLSGTMPAGVNSSTYLPIIGFVDRNASRSEWRYETQEEYTVDYWSHVLGHTLCNRSDMPPEPSPDTLVKNATSALIYFGPFSWRTHEWDTVVKLMQSAIDDPPFALGGRLGVWNELVLDVPIDEREFASRAVQAVFYIKGISGTVTELLARRIAQREARRLQKPLLYIDLSAAGNHQGATTDDIFHCAEAGQRIGEQTDNSGTVGETSTGGGSHLRSSAS
jgi:hypothetical protein